MNAPVLKFITEYAKENAVRLHMPAHKGKSTDKTDGLSPELFDITEIEGAGDLYAPDGIVFESEQNASSLFGADTFYSAEGSSLSIRAMLYLALKYSLNTGKGRTIVAARNVHRSFISAAAFLDLSVQWIYGDFNYLSCNVTPNELATFLDGLTEKPFAVYITSPDYVGNIADIKGLSDVCKARDIILLVDNAHGAYLKFLPISLHPIDLGATMCCDSAHKTLHTLTGGAYLHIAKSAPDFYKKNAKSALSLFGTSSPSYLILCSLDKTNLLLSDNFKEKLKEKTEQVKSIKAALINAGFILCGSEDLKITVSPKKYGYTGREINGYLRSQNIVCEFFDDDYITFMVSVNTEKEHLDRLKTALLSLKQRKALTALPPPASRLKIATSIRSALLSPSETVSAEKSSGRILSSVTASCPPAVPIAVCGEIIDDNTVKAFHYYGIKTCSVIKEQV